MGKVYKNKTCDVCGKTGRVIETWGKLYCRSCWDKKPKKGDGHSGMIKIRDFAFSDKLIYEPGLKLCPTTKGNRVFSNLYLRHYPDSKGIWGRQCNYIIEQDGQIVGIIGANGPPLRFKKFEAVFGTNMESHYLNNNVFRLIIRQKNLGTRTLRLFRCTVARDYWSKYGDKLVGLVTFVEPPREGIVYRADNWRYLGMTEGKRCVRRGDHGKWINKEWSTGTKKLIFCYTLNRRSAGEGSRENRRATSSEGVGQFHDPALY